MGQDAIKYVNRFFTKVQKGEGCWEWKAGKSVDGYGRFWDGEREQKAHRFSYLIHYGSIPRGACVCHSCDNPACVNPDHLWLGTHAENMVDRNRKGRTHIPAGEKHARARLTANIVRKIREEAKTTPHRVLASRYGITTDYVSEVVRRKAWSHIG